MASLLKSTSDQLSSRYALEQTVLAAKNFYREAEDIDPTSTDSAARKKIWLALCVELKVVKEFQSSALFIAALEEEVAAAKAAYTAADEANGDNTTVLFQTYQTMKSTLKAAVAEAAAVSDATPEGETKEEAVVAAKSVAPVETMKVLEGHADMVKSVDYSSDGRFVVSGSRRCGYGM